MSSNAKWRGTFTALVTPFTVAGAIDHAALRRLVEMQIEGGVEGLLPCGTTGEAATLTNDEHLGVIEDVISFADGRTVVLAGVGGNDTRNVIELGRRAATAGADGILAVAPYYNKPTQAGMLAHFTAIAEAVSVPLVLYNVPGRTSSNILPETVLQLAEHPNIVGIKEASGDLGQVMRILAAAPSGFSVLSGEDDLTLAMICLGARGVVSVVSNEVPAQMSDLVRRALAGDLDEARVIHYRLLDLMYANFIETNPIPAKAALAMMGLIEEAYRLPLVRMSAENRAQLARALDRLGLIDSA
jgi:4-hydroxy-tetrahydrodipicolinate synthase